EPHAELGEIEASAAERSGLEAVDLDCALSGSERESGGCGIGGEAHPPGAERRREVEARAAVGGPGAVAAAVREADGAAVGGLVAAPEHDRDGEHRQADHGATSTQRSLSRTQTRRGGASVSVR